MLLEEIKQNEIMVEYIGKNYTQKNIIINIYKKLSQKNIQALEDLNNLHIFQKPIVFSSLTFFVKIFIGK